MKRMTLSAGVALAMASLAPGQNVEFDTPWRAYNLGNYPEGSPWDSGTADFDGDGRTDLATVSWGANGRLAVIFGNGRGGFERLARYPLQSSSRGMAIADLDGDGDPDVAVSNTGSLWDDTTVSAFINQGDGTFTESGPFFAGPGPTGITAADLDGDGLPEIIVAHDTLITAGNSYAVLKNLGGGVFGAPTIRTLPSSSFQVEAADLNGDGRIDLVVAGEMRDLSVLLGTAEGFAPPVAYLAWPQRYLDVSPSMALADVDLDGDIDVVYSASGATLGTFGGTGQVALLRNNGNGTLQAPEHLPMLFREGAAVGLEVADVTEDGWPDILASHGGRNFWGILPSDGAGGFGAIVTHRSGAGPVRTESIDVDGDGRRDVIAVAGSSITAAVHLNQGGGQFPTLAIDAMVPEANAPASYSHTSSSDLDGDGDLDVIVGYSLNYESLYGLSVALNNGDGTFAPRQLYPAPSFPAFMAIGDLDLDGDDDAVWVDDQFPLRLGYSLNQGDGTFGPAELGPTLADDADGIELADLDGDGVPEALVGGVFGQLSVARFNGAGFAPFYAVPLGASPSAIAAGDVNGDGKTDVLTNTGIQAWMEVSVGNGDGTFRTPWTVQTGFGIAALVIGDLNGDGVNDVATANDNDASMTVLINRGPGVFYPPVAYPAGRSGYNGFQSIIARDVDGDDDLDLLAANFSAQDISLWRNRGDGTFDDPLRLGVGREVWDVEIGDFTGDGTLDLVAQVEPRSSTNGWYYPGISLIRGTSGDAWDDLGFGLAGTHGVPVHRGLSTLREGQPYVLRIDNALENSAGVIVFGGSQINLPILGGTMVPLPVIAVPIATDASGSWVFGTLWGQTPAGLSLYTQAWILDGVAPGGLSATNGLRSTTPQ